MVNYDDYVELIIDDLGKERCFVVNDGKKIEINGRDAKIISNILKDLPYKNGFNGSKIYTQMEQIMDLYQKRIEKLKLAKAKRDKVNRDKSRRIKIFLFSLALSVSAGVGIAVIKNSKKSNVNVDSNSTITYEDKNSNINDSSEGMLSQEDVKYEDEDVLEFEYYYEKKADNTNLENAKENEDLFVKYGKRYGIDSNILMAMSAVESAGIHYINYDESALGIMQVERSQWLYNSISAYNYEENRMETVTITNEMLEDKQTNIKIGTMILQNNINKAYKYGYLNDRIDKNEIAPYAFQRYNMGGGTTTKLLDMGGDWKDNREFASCGDSLYFEKIFSYLQLMNISKFGIKCYDEETNNIVEINTKIINSYNKENVMSK